MVQCQCLTNCTPTPLLIQQQWTNNKFGFVLDYGRGRCAVSHILTLIGMDLGHVDSSDRKFPQTRNVKLLCYWLKKEFLTKGNADLFIPWSCGKVFVIFTPSTWPNNPCVLIFLVASSNKTEELTCSIQKKWNKQIKDHSLLIVGGGGVGGFRKGRNHMVFRENGGGSVVTNRVLRGGGWGPEKIDWQWGRGTSQFCRAWEEGGRGPVNLIVTQPVSPGDNRSLSKI